VNRKKSLRDSGSHCSCCIRPVTHSSLVFSTCGYAIFGGAIAPFAVRFDSYNTQGVLASRGVKERHRNRPDFTRNFLFPKNRLRYCLSEHSDFN
jgi:hypothetical protein